MDGLDDFRLVVGAADGVTNHLEDDRPVFAGELLGEYHVDKVLDHLVAFEVIREELFLVVGLLLADSLLVKVANRLTHVAGIAWTDRYELRARLVHVEFHIVISTTEGSHGAQVVAGHGFGRSTLNLTICL